MTTMIVDDLGRIPMSPYLTATLTRAADYATAQSHREVTLEHLLLALAEDPEATVVLKSSHIDLPRLVAEVSDHLGRSEDRIDPASGQTIAISADLRRILEAAAAAAKQGRRREINGAIVLAAIVGDGKSTAAHLLRLQGLTFEEAIRALQRATAAPPPQPQPAPAPPRGPEPEPESEADSHPVPDLGAPPPPDLTRPASTEEILASARERLQQGHSEPPAAPQPMPRANYPAQQAPPRPQPAPPPPMAPTSPPSPFDDGVPTTGGRPAPRWPRADEPYLAPDGPRSSDEPPTLQRAAPPPGQPPPAPMPGGPPTRSAATFDDVPRTAPPSLSVPDRRRAASTGPFVGSWPLIESGQLVENIPRRMRVGIPVVAEARIARADVKALAEGLAGGGAAFRHEVVVTKAMSVRLRAPDGGFTIENRSPETQWIENVLGLGSDDFASWRWTVTPRTRGRRQLQLIVSARTVGADGITAETALPDQIVEVKVAINYARTAARWIGWIAAAVIGGLLAKFGETGWVIAQLLIAKHLGG
jgi:hypothetical protein